jgi:putative hydrolase of HD superfamily
LLLEFNEKRTEEALLSHDADQLDLLLQLKEQQDLGNDQADAWLRNNTKRLNTEEGKKVASAILQTEFFGWWFKGPDDDWWVTGR